MLKKRILLILVLVFILCTCGKEDEAMEVTLKHIDHSIQSDSGQIIAEIYYEKPELKGDTDSVKLINSYFDNEANEWMNGTSNRLTHFKEDMLENFLEDVNETREFMDDNIIAKQPFIYTVNTELMLLNSRYISFMQIVTVQTAGPRSWYYYGSTFDLMTGKLLPIDAMIETEPYSLKKMISSFINENGKSLSFDNLEMFNSMYSIDKSNSYKLEYDHEDIQLDYEYFCDDKNIYIILNHGVLYDNGCIIKWNGQYNKDFIGKLIGYVLMDNHNIKEIEY